jgi:hypothetical protein
MTITKGTIDFNKEILFGECGALLGTQAGGYISAYLTNSVDIIASSVVFGAIVMASLFWAIMRIYDKSHRDNYSKDKFIDDVKYFTPASAFLTIFFYYPTLFLATRHFLINGRIVEFSAIVAQTIAFAIFIMGINLYRFILIKYYKKEL